ncbi:MAG: hypothetical protein QOJ13_569 [Gaiellales bacterium]|jgi:hypothetical protein|nr:hypothetical protein [Gaiellales bacterium]MDX6591373.1 hypothetical protein [Gaiellales bacterium]
MRTRAGRETAAAPSTQRRRAIASFTTYRDAERAVDHLADSGFPVERVSIVARGLELVEQVTGRMGWGRAALNGALTGAIVGALIGWLFGVFDWFNPVVSAFWLAVDGLWFGALVGAGLGLLTYAASSGGRRDFTSVSGLKADRYDILVDDEVADEAAKLLSTLSSPSMTTP